MKDTKSDVKVEEIPLCKFCQKPIDKVVVINTSHTDNWYELVDGKFIFDTSVIDNEETEYQCGYCNNELDSHCERFFKENYEKGLVKK